MWLLSLSATGSGEPLVILHGLGSSKRFIERLLVPLLASEFRVIAIDLPGHGGSSALQTEDPKRAIDEIAERVLATLSAARISQFSLVGISFGGTVALRVAARAQHRLRALIVQGAPLYGREFPLLYRVLLRALRILFHLAGPCGLRIGRWIFQRANTGRGRLPEALRDIAAADRRDGDFLTWWTIVAAVLRHDARSDARRLHIPVLLVDGTRTGLFAVDTTERLSRLIQQAQQCRIAGANHLLPATHPRDFAAAIRDFLHRALRQ